MFYSSIRQVLHNPWVFRVTDVSENKTYIKLHFYFSMFKLNSANTNEGLHAFKIYNTYFQITNFNN